MIRALLDTNVLVSAILGSLSASSPPGEILRAWEQDRFSIVISSEVLDELKRTFRKPFFLGHARSSEFAGAILTLELAATCVVPSRTIQGIATHPEDDRIRAATIAADADYLVTGDKQLLRLGHIRGIPILSPHAFLDLLRIELRRSLGDESAG